MDSRNYKEVLNKISFSILIIAISFANGKSQDINYLDLSSDENLKEIKTEKVKIKGSISLFGHQRSVIINDKTDFKSTVRKGANPDLAKNTFKEFDLKKQTIIGINLVSGLKGLSDLQYKTYEDAELKQYIVYLSYHSITSPFEDTVCHPVWFIIPAQKEGYEIKFCVDPKIML